MASRNQNRPPRSPSTKIGGDEVPLDKKRRLTGKADSQSSMGRPRLPLKSVNKRQEVGAASETASVEGSECSEAEREFTKEEVEELLNKKYIEKKFDHKGNAQQRAAYHKNLKDCIKWYQKVEKAHLLEVERLQNLLNASEKKCTDTEEKMKNMVDELNAINLKLATLEEKLAKEESDKMDAIRSHKKEKEERADLSAELEKVREQKLVIEQRAIKFEDDYNRTQEYNKSLQQYNSKLQSDVNTMDESRKRAENEKLTMVENLSNLRGHKKALEDQLASHKASLDDALKQNECLRGQLQEVRDDRDHHVKENHDLKAEVVKHFAELDKLVRKTKDLEETCSSQMMQVDSLKNERDQLRHERDVLKQERDAAHEKIEMSDLSASEISTRFELQKRVERELRDRIAEYELKIIEGDRLRKKLHNDIQELKGNIRVFCRVRPLLPDDATEVPVISYPTSTEDLGRSIDLVQSGQKYHFTFDKVFDHAASQNDVFEEISQLVQSALDGYKVCIFAYGQTGSGKTYTMMGRPENPDQKGLIPRSVDQIFQTSQSLQAQGWKYTMQASMLEIYNETIRDLLSTNRPSGTELTRTESGVGKQYTIKHDVNGNTHVSDLTIIDVCSKREISSLLQQAAQSRSVGKTHMNEQSSRSHLVFTLRITGINENTEQQVQGVLNLIDLAGSERLSRSGATGERLKETQAINKSLSSLSDVISALAKKDDHIPFRNSKLTYLLQPCLGGDSKTLMFVNVSPDSTSVGESLCSLRFAHRVNACEIGVPRRQTTARPTTSDSRLSYG
uniref:kinesin-1 isoform X2 n=1 Tax=Fragaria vesca subsp. vesca TaxID=101020 RepID=UPI0005C88D0A|nr:PREDICTED: kinesin-1 isoform X2 [Fragaria vesca subsp. vesca]